MENCSSAMLFSSFSHLMKFILCILHSKILLRRDRFSPPVSCNRAPRPVFSVCEMRGRARSIGCNNRVKTYYSTFQTQLPDQILTFCSFRPHFPPLIDAVGAETQAIGTDKLIPDAVHIALHRVPDGVSVQVAVVTAGDAVGFKVATISGALVPV